MASCATCATAPAGSGPRRATHAFAAHRNRSGPGTNRPRRCRRPDPPADAQRSLPHSLSVPTLPLHDATTPRPSAYKTRIPGAGGGVSSRAVEPGPKFSAHRLRHPGGSHSFQTMIGRRTSGSNHVSSRDRRVSWSSIFRPVASTQRRGEPHLDSLCPEAQGGQGRPWSTELLASLHARRRIWGRWCRRSSAHLCVRRMDIVLASRMAQHPRSYWSLPGVARVQHFGTTSGRSTSAVGVVRIVTSGRGRQVLWHRGAVPRDLMYLYPPTPHNRTSGCHQWRWGLR